MQGTVRFVLYDSNNDAEPKYPPEISLEEFFLFLSEHEDTDCTPCPGGKKCRRKDGPAWAPGWITPGERRRGASVESFDVLAFDLDHLTEKSFWDALARLEGLTCLLYTTHSHKPELPEYRDKKTNQLCGGYCARIVFGLSRRVRASEYPQVWRAVVRKYSLSADPKANDPSRLFFLPRAPRGAPRINEHEFGQPLDVDALLLEEIDFARTAQHKVVHALPVPTESDPNVTDMDALRAAMRRYNPNDDFDGSKRELVRRVLNREPLADKGERDASVHRIGKILGWVLPLGTSKDAVEELVRPSTSKIPSYDDDAAEEGPAFWLAKALHNFEVAQQDKLKSEAAKGNIIALAKSRGWSEVGGAPLPASAPPTSPDAGSDGAVQVGDDPDKWRIQLIRNPKTALPTDAGANVTVVLSQHPQWRGALRWNVASKAIECYGGPLSESDRDPSQLLTAIEIWLQQCEGIVASTNTVAAHMTYVARKNPIDPVRDYLLAPVWDGEPRIETFLEQHCHARLCEDGRDFTDFVRMVSRRWFIGAVARALKPGCKMDNVLVLEGVEGLRKSSVFRALGGEFFTDASVNITDKDSKMLVAKYWIVELSELVAIRRVETEAQKAFFSREHDDFRAPYGKVIETNPRRCVFVGTTNEQNYLASLTGNRRYWPVYCESDIDIGQIRELRDQLWAEAVAAFQANERYYFTRDEDELYRDVTESRLTADSEMGVVAETIMDWWNAMEPHARPTQFSMLDIALGALGMQRGQIDSRKTAPIGRALRHLGFQCRRLRVNGIPTRMYVPDESLRMAPKVDNKRRHLSLIANAVVVAPPVSEAPGTVVPTREST